MISVLFMISVNVSCEWKLSRDYDSLASDYYYVVLTCVLTHAHTITHSIRSRLIPTTGTSSISGIPNTGTSSSDVS